jgi:hypothetical protein
MIFRATLQEGNDVEVAVVAPPTTREWFSPEKTKTKQEASQQTPTRRFTTPEDAVVVDTNTIAGYGFPPKLHRMPT